MSNLRSIRKDAEFTISYGPQDAKNHRATNLFIFITQEPQGI